MKSPSGSEQVLSLKWVLENVANLNSEDAMQATCEVFGIAVKNWQKLIEDASWYVGDSRLYSHEKIQSIWNRRFSSLTNIWLDEDVWHAPLWELWLRSPKMIFAANFSYLKEVGGRGTVVGLAKFIGRNVTTVSKWGRWQEEDRKVRLPPSTVYPKVVEYFDLKPSCDLSKEPLFLGRDAIQDALLRIEGKHYLECLSGEHLGQAVDRLREESVRQLTKKLNS